MTKGIEKIIEDLDFVSNRIGEQTRTISIGVLAIAWLFLAGGKDAPAVKNPPDVNTLLLAGGLAITALIVDYLQYLFGYFVSAKALKTAERNTFDEADYDYNSFAHRARRFFFWGKQVICLLSTGILIYAIIRAILNI